MNTTLQQPKTEARPATAAKSKKQIRLVKVSTRKEFATLEPEWDDFLSKTQVPSPFQSWNYLDVWWSVYGDSGYDVKLFIARDDEGQLIGAVPLMITQRGSFPGNRGRFRHLAFMGGAGEMLGESLELPACPGFEKALGEAAADIILNSLQGQWDLLYFYLVPEKSISSNAMMNVLSKNGMPLQMTHSLRSPYISTKGESWDEHMATRSTKFVSRNRYVQTYAAKRYDIARDTVGEDVSVNKGIDNLVRLCTGRWGKSAQAFHTPTFVDFHRQLAPRLIKKEQLHFELLKLDNKVVGAVYDFVFDNKLWGYQAPWDLEYKAVRPGNLLYILSIKTAFDMGLRELDCLPGESGPKNEWSNDAHILNIYEAACPRSMGGTLFKIARKLDEVIKQKTQTTPKS